MSDNIQTNSKTLTQLFVGIEEQFPKKERPIVEALLSRIQKSYSYSGSDIIVPYEPLYDECPASEKLLLKDLFNEMCKMCGLVIFYDYTQPLVGNTLMIKEVFITNNKATFYKELTKSLSEELFFSFISSQRTKNITNSYLYENNFFVNISLIETILEKKNILDVLQSFVDPEIIIFENKFVLTESVIKSIVKRQGNAFFDILQEEDLKKLGARSPSELGVKISNSDKLEEMLACFQNILNIRGEMLSLPQRAMIFTFDQYKIIFDNQNGMGSDLVNTVNNEVLFVQKYIINSDDALEVSDINEFLNDPAIMGKFTSEEFKIFYKKIWESIQNCNEIAKVDAYFFGIEKTYQIFQKRLRIARSSLIKKLHITFKNLLTQPKISDNEIMEFIHVKLQQLYLDTLDERSNPLLNRLLFSKKSIILRHSMKMSAPKKVMELFFSFTYNDPGKLSLNSPLIFMEIDLLKVIKEAYFSFGWKRFLKMFRFARIRYYAKLLVKQLKKENSGNGGK